MIFLEKVIITGTIATLAPSCSQQQKKLSVHTPVIATSSSIDPYLKRIDITGYLSKANLGIEGFCLNEQTSKRFYTIDLFDKKRVEYEHGFHQSSLYQTLSSLVTSGPVKMQIKGWTRKGRMHSLAVHNNSDLFDDPSLEQKMDEYYYVSPDSICIFVKDGTKQLYTPKRWVGPQNHDPSSWTEN